MQEIENPVSRKTDDKKPRTALESDDGNESEDHHKQQLRNERRCGSTHNSEEDVVRGDNNEYYRVETALSVQTNKAGKD